MSHIRVFIADDHELVRLALRTLLEAEPDIEVVGEAPDGVQAIEGVNETKPDVLLLDMRMPEADGVEVCSRLSESCASTHILVLTSYDDDDEVFGVLAAGASGYILKDTRSETVVQAVRSVADGQSVFDFKVAKRVISGPKNGEDQAGSSEHELLSEREMEVLRLMSKGMSNKEIGRALWIGETTVKTHVSHILRKLEQGDRTQAVLAAVKLGIVSLGGEARTK
ncbi:MAG: response regulator transcription factor [Actinomycetota bacterium]|nr:response regulator transcription factor [Actinomycetota bacterium]